jgi:hypothetical protein
MFRGDESDRRRKVAWKLRRKNARGSSRRLGFEMMESRSLLSATPVSTGPLDLRLFQLNWSAASVDGGTVTISSPADNDGGYISDTTALTYGGTSNSAPIANVISSVSDMDDLVSRGATIAYSNTTAGSLGLNSTGNAIGGGMLPLVIASPEGGVSLRANIEPVREGVGAPTGDQNPGGVISIQALLPPSGRGGDYQSTQPSWNNYVSNPTDARSIPTTLETTRLPATASLSGEWARIMIFETAGGEPVLGQSAGATQDGLMTISDSESSAAGSLSVDAHLLNHNASDSNSQAEKPDVKSTTDWRAAGLQQPLSAAESAAIERLDSILMKGIDRQTIRFSILNLLKLEHTSNADEHRVGSETSDVSYVKVLQNMTENNHQVVPLGGDEKTQSASFDTIPFVVALSLERIINRASNRSRQRETAVVQKPPRRIED